MSENKSCNPNNRKEALLELLHREGLAGVFALTTGKKVTILSNEHKQEGIQDVPTHMS